MKKYMGSKKLLSVWEKRRFSGLAGRQEFERNKPAEMLGREFCLSSLQWKGR